MTKHVRTTRKLQAEMLEPRHLLNGDTRFVAGPNEFGRSSDLEIFQHHAASGETVYFSSYSPASAKVLWRSQGQTSNTTVVRNSDGELLPDPRYGLSIGQTFYVQAVNALWRVADSISSATKVPLPADVIPIGPMAEFNGALYFPASSPTHGVELWRTDGVTTANTRLVKDIAALEASANPAKFTLFNGRLYFIASSAEHGREWYYTDGSTAGTKLLKNIDLSFSEDNDFRTEIVRDQLYFVRNQSLWVTNGTSAGTRQVSTLVENVSTMQALGDKLFFTATTVLDSKREFWQTDGTSAGTVQRKDLLSGKTSAVPFLVASVSHQLFFIADSGIDQERQLWASDGTATGTIMLRGLNHSPQDGGYSKFSSVNSTLYFTVSSEDGSRLYRSDGTTPGTYPIPGDALRVDKLSLVGDQLYFTAYLGNSGALYVVNTARAVSPAEWTVTKNANGRVEIYETTQFGNEDLLRVERNGPNLVLTETGKRPLRIKNTIPQDVIVQGRRIVIPMAKIETSGQSLIINLGLGHDTIALDTNGATGDIFPKTGFTMDLGTGSDTLDLIDNTTNNTWSLGSNRSGNVKIGSLGRASFHQLENAQGGAGADAFHVAYEKKGNYIALDGESQGGNNSLNFQADADIELSANEMIIHAPASPVHRFHVFNIQLAALTGGASDNVLDAADFPGSVTLSGAGGNDILFGSRKDDVLLGGAGADWFSGIGGNDTIRGETGRDFLFGGNGTDILYGGDGEDILSGGNAVTPGVFAIRDLIVAWNSGGTYEERMASLARKMLHSSDEFADTFFGESGLDWFFAEPHAPGDEIDVLTVGVRDRLTMEQITHI